VRDSSFCSVSVNLESLRFLANGFEGLRQGKPEETFNELIIKNKKKRDKKIGEMSSLSSNRGGDN